MITKSNRRSILALGLVATLGSAFTLAAPNAHAREQQSDEQSLERSHVAPVDREETHSSEPPTLWQELRVGMSPEEVVPILRVLPGISKARLYRRRASDNPSQVRISYRSDGIQIAGMPFKVEPRFKSKLLDQVWLASTDQCSNDAVTVLDEVSAGLSAKYPEAIFEEEFRRIELARANRRARRSGESVQTSRIYASQRIAVLLTLSFSAESPPPYPGSANRLARSLYQIARSSYLQRSQECSGTGTNRMDVALQYMARSAFDARAAELVEEIEQEQADLVSQL